MIERMKKVTLLVSEKDRKTIVRRLREAGVLHVKHVTAPEHHEINFIEDRISRIEHMIDVLRPYARGVEADKEASDHEKDLLCRCEEVAELHSEKQDIEEEKRQIKEQLSWFGPWGVFDPRDLDFLEEKGYTVKLYRVRTSELARIPEEVEHFVLGSSRGVTYLAALTKGEEQDMPFENVKVPPAGPREMRRRLEKLEKSLKEIEERFSDTARGMEAMLRCERKLKKEHESLAVRFGMKEEGNFSYVQGFCPVKDVEKICAMAKEHGSGYVLQEPDDPEETPTHITNPKWIRLIDPVFKFMNTLPGYDEVDISSYFLVFFSLFFAMLIGDAGYGAIFLVATWLARRKFRRLPGEPFFLMYLLSVSTIVWGVITGTYFGVEKIAELPVLNTLVIERISSFSDKSQNSVIFICFVIGAVQLTIAHLVRAARMINSVKALAEGGWIMILWGMFFAAGKFVIGRPFPPPAGWSIAAGVVLVLFCTEPGKGVIRGALKTMANLPLSIISSFSDIVSYLRLFAVGYATVVVAESFNNMAVGDGVNSLLGAFMAAVILFLGHALNITLGFMAVIVHGIRLNMLEFSNHLGMQWSGKKYEPFRE